MVSPTSPQTVFRPLGTVLVQEGLISPKELEQAVSYKIKNGGKLGQCLIRLGLLDAAQLTLALDKQGRLSCISLNPEMVDVSIAGKLGEKASREHNAIAINRIAGYTTVAMDDPQGVHSIDAIQKILGGRIFPVFAEREKLNEAFKYVFNIRGQSSGEGGELSVAKLAEMAYAEDDGNNGLDSSRALAGIHDEYDEENLDDVDAAPIINLVSRILLEGYSEGASDIHIEPRLKDYNIRFRVDGSCYVKTTIPRSWATRMIVRIKLMADMDIAQRRLPQDGRAQFHAGKNRVDLRVTTTPTVTGEGVVVRILDGGRELKDIFSLGLRDEQVDSLRRLIACREGFILATGPTGSGKTTTLYALLNLLISEERKIITLEDPVENVFDGVTQINANKKIGLTFATGLRSILRQDPDIVLVGEIRDEETATIAVEASMTGHIVLSSLHTVGAVESVTRLLDMGVESYQLGDTLKGVVAQRLLRKICTYCREEACPDPIVLRMLGIDDPDAKFYEGRGCPRCRHTGYKGRIGIYEILVVDADLRRLIQEGATTAVISEAAIKAGLSSLRTEGLKRATRGEVTLSDVMSITN